MDRAQPAVTDNPVAAAGLTWPHLALALAIVAVWGTNFVVIHEALRQFPPLLLAALRFGLAAFPAILLVPRPATRWRNIIGYGLAIGAGQFGLLFIAMNGMIAPGLASLVIQSQVFFTIALSALLHGENTGSSPVGVTSEINYLASFEPAVWRSSPIHPQYRASAGDGYPRTSRGLLLWGSTGLAS